MTEAVVTPAGTTAMSQPGRSRARFWTIQALIFGVTLVHGLLEMGARNGDLHGLLGGLEDLPIQLFVLPMVLAGYWFGLTGALACGALAVLLSVPNLVVFHRTDFAWLGELLSGIVVLAVGIAVGVVAERAVTARLTAQTARRRLTTLQQVSSAVARYDSVPELVRAVLEAVVASDGVVAASLVGAVDPSSPVIGDRDCAIFKAGAAVWAGVTSPASNSASAPIEVQGATLGVLTAYTDLEGPGTRDLIVHVARDLSFAVDRALERAAGRAKLERHARAVTDAQEVERRRVARDLHDGPAQSLVVLERGLRHLAASEQDPSAVHEAEDLAALANETRQAVRETMSALRPSLLDDLGLVPALQSLAERATTPGLEIAVRSSGDPRRLGDLVEVTAYRIAQEALANAVAHSGCRSVEISASFDPDGLTLTIVDDGHGFDEAMQARATALGILGMRERAALVGGTLEITTGSGGTTVAFAAAD